MKAESNLNCILEFLPRLIKEHKSGSDTYLVFQTIVKNCVDELFSPASKQKANLAPFGDISLPFYDMGAINSTHLFNLDELIIFSFYAQNTGRYKFVADIGANIGLHSIMLSKLGFVVRCFEPDPLTFDRLKKNISLNKVDSQIDAIQKAVSNKGGYASFTRVLGNMTGSHLDGAKTNAYGELERFDVELEDFRDIMKFADLIKIDIEGHEAEILCNTVREDWLKVDAIVEVGSSENARRIYSHLCDLDLKMFSQKSGWEQVESIEAMPVSYKEGSLFISPDSYMPWG